MTAGGLAVLIGLWGHLFVPAELLSVLLLALLVTAVIAMRIGGNGLPPLPEGVTAATSDEVRAIKRRGVAMIWLSVVVVPGCFGLYWFRPYLSPYDTLLAAILTALSVVWALTIARLRRRYLALASSLGAAGAPSTGPTPR